MKQFRYFLYILIIFFLLITCHLSTSLETGLSLVAPAKAIVDPRSFPNNKFGIHIISATPDEVKAASDLVNSSGGDWGYVTVLIEDKDKNKQKWQAFFNELREAHLIPIVRLATHPENAHWRRPTLEDAKEWALFLDSLVWPVKNRYVLIYNEPNQGAEWGREADPRDYARVLDQTIDELKAKSEHFFVLNGAFDQAAPDEPPNYYDEALFLREMNEEVPGIFNKLDGFASHPYPNPGFVGSPQGSGRGSVRGFEWELSVLKNLGLKKDLPVFISETGWKHAEGIELDKSLPRAETIGKYYSLAFDNAWGSSKIVAVTPFLLNYQQHPFDHFSFKKITGEKQNVKILGLEYPEFYPHYQTIADLGKLTGYPYQGYKANLEKGEIYQNLVSGENYIIPLTFKNIGEAVWNEYKQIKLIITSELGFEIQPVEIPIYKKIKPGEEYTFNVVLKAPLQGSYNIVLNLYANDTKFENSDLTFNTQIQPPVILKITSNLKWKKSSQGEFFLGIKTAIGDKYQKINLDSKGQSLELEARYLLPGYQFEFSLNKQFYKTKTIKKKVISGENILDFGTLEPDFQSSLFNLKEFWRLLPFSN